MSVSPTCYCKPPHCEVFQQLSILISTQWPNNTGCPVLLLIVFISILLPLFSRLNKEFLFLLVTSLKQCLLLVTIKYYVNLGSQLKIRHNLLFGQLMVIVASTVFD